MQPYMRHATRYDMRMVTYVGQEGSRPSFDLVVRAALFFVPPVHPYLYIDSGKYSRSMLLVLLEAWKFSQR